ncbi:MAG: glycerate kinase [Clostridiales bacterium]|nr:glycerate kinase [Clostridiales bacterium]
MKAAVAMDSFKGSMTSLEAGNAVKRGILRACPDAEVVVLPLADGGEGTIDAIAPFVDGVERCITVTGPLGKSVDASYIYVPSTRTAYIEMAKAAGLTLLKDEERDPYNTTTYGVGELMKDAMENGAKELVICIGGSATNDGGAGLLQALGAEFKDKDGRGIKRGCIGLKDLDSVRFTGQFCEGVSITVASDVTNPLCGPDGASFVYAPQKGATLEMCRKMDLWLKGFAEKCGFDPYEPGTGAAGGMSFALKNFLGAKIESGADIVLKITGAEELISRCDLVVTGEGRMDSQTVSGKGPFKVMQLAQKYKKPVYGITGVLGYGYEECLKAGFEKIVPLAVPVMEKEVAMKSAEETAEVLFDQPKR